MKALARNSYRALMRLLMPNSGLTRLAFNGPVNAMFAGAPQLAGTMRDGLEVEVDPQDYNGRVLWLFGSNDIKVSRTVNALLDPGDVFLDIGANYGTIGFAARHAVGPRGAVHLFEPQPQLARKLAGVIAQGCENVTLHPVALFDADGTMALSVPADNCGSATLVNDPRRDETRQWRDVEVRVCATLPTVGPLVAGRRFGAKIDIEGAEPAVLADLVTLPGLKFVVFEGDKNSRELFELFTGSGFAIFGLCKTVLSPRIGRVAGMGDWGRYHDFVAVPERVAAGAPAKVSLTAFARRSRLAA